MVSIAGSKKLKRQMAPMFWGITRKDKRFVVTVRPGPHPKRKSIPAAVLVRDTLGLARTLREAKSSLYSGRLRVDGVVRKSLHHGVGLMDVVELEGVGAYRMLPGGGALLRPVPIGDGDGGEKDRKLCAVTSKTTIRGGRTQIGLHDGRSIILDGGADSVRIGDSCLIRVPGQEVIETVRLEAGALAMVTRGANAGRVGKVVEVRDGTFVLQRMATLSIMEGGSETRRIEIPTSIIMAVGRDRPVIRVARDAEKGQ